MKIRRASKHDVESVIELIKELATYEKCQDEVVANQQDLTELLFGENAIVNCVVCEHDARLIAFSAYYFTGSTWLAKKGLHIEDVYVVPQFRGCGVGKKLMSWIAREAIATDCHRIDWRVLDWNVDARRFYERLRASNLSQWLSYRLTRDQMGDLAESDVDGDFVVRDGNPAQA